MKGGRGIGEEWAPRPTRFAAEVLAARYDEAHPAPERDGWEWCWALVEGGRAPTVREVACWAGWGRTKAARVRHEAVTAHDHWTGTAPATPNVPAARQPRDTSRATRSAPAADRSADARHQTRQRNDTPRDDRARVLLDTLTTPSGIGAAVAVAEAEGLAVEVRLAIPEVPTPYTAAIRAWDEEHRAAMGVGYTWVFSGGRDPDGLKVKRWIRTVGADNGHAIEGVDRLRLAMRAYFAASRKGAAFPKGDPPTTSWFDRDLVKWLAVGARATGPPKTWDEDALYREARRRKPCPNDDDDEVRSAWIETLTREVLPEIRADIAAGRLPARPP